LYPAIVRLGAAIVLRIGYGVLPDSALGRRLTSALVAYKSETIVPDARRRMDGFAQGPRKLLDLPWFLQTFVRMRRGMRGVSSVVREVMAARNGNGGLDWLGRLREAGLSRKEIAGEANHLYGAYNAIDYVTTCGLYELSRHPEWITRLRAEWRAVLGDGAIPTPQTIPSLHDTMNVMREVLRMYPVTHAVARRTGAPLELGGDTHPEGTEIVLLLYALHHHPDHFDDALRFDPDRWAREPAPPKVPFAYVPFLDGPRKCIGRHMAELQFVVVIHALFARYDIVVERPDLPLTTLVVPRFVSPIPTAVSPRVSETGR
jgi:cytochrome P450